MSRRVAALLVGGLLLGGCAAGRPHGGTGSASAPTALWIGDSYTAGDGADSRETGEAYETSAKLDWYAHVDAEGGTGFVNNGLSAEPDYAALPARLTGDSEEFPDPGVVVIDAGRNDTPFPLKKVHRTVTSYFRSLAKAYPSSAVVVVAPYLMTSTRTDFIAIRHLLAAQARRRGWAFVDPIAEGWIGKSSAKLVAADGVHPDQAGHDYIAAHLAPAIERALAAAHEKVG